MDGFIQDLRYALRGFRRSPLFTLAALVCLGVGIGMNGAAFSLARGFLLAELPYEDPTSILVVEGVNEEAAILEDGGLVWADLVALRNTDLFTEVGAFREGSVNLTGGDRPERVQTLAVTPNLFRLLGVAPTLGRSFGPDDAGPEGAEQVALISDRLWKRSFGAAPEIVGREVLVNGRAVTVLGVMPEGFRFPETHDLWLPTRAQNPTDRSSREYMALARTRPAASLEAVRGGLATLSDRLARTYPESHRYWAFAATPIRERAVGGEAGLEFLLISGAVTLVLLIACVNVANLLLARGLGRGREVGVRSALGASRKRLVRQLLTESLLLAAGGAAAGAIMAAWMVELVVRSVPETEDLPHWVSIDVDGTVLLFIGALGVLTTLLSGLVPALRSSRVDLTAGLRSSASWVKGGGSSGVLDGLVGLQVAMALVLVLTAGLMMRSFMALATADPGFDPEPLLTARLVLSGDRYQDPRARAAFFQDVAERIEGAPGVRGAVWTGAIPADDGGETLLLPRDGSDTEGPGLAVTVVPVTAGFFRTLGLPLTGGVEPRPEAVRDPTARVAVVGRRLAERLWPGAEAVGRTLRLTEELELRVVGVAPDLQYEEFGETTESSLHQIHVPYGLAGWRQMALLVRGQGPPEELAPVVRGALRAVDPQLPLFEVMTMERRLRETKWGAQFIGALFGIYGLAALVLALAGIYGVTAYRVGRRRAEMGIRIALGATRTTVLREATAGILKVALVGAAGGLVLAVLATRTLRGILYGVSVSDPLTFVSVTAVMVVAAVLATVVPARRAARLDPSEALRVE